MIQETRNIVNIGNKPLPYYNSGNTFLDKEWAAALRREFAPKLKRRIPGHHLNGLPHNYIVQFVNRYKKKFPYFIKTDINKFYPSIQHTDLVVGMQIAYRDLLSLKFVPRGFQQRYVRPVNEWLKSLPVNRGIPLGSSMSAILAPVMLLPMWLHVKRKYQVPFIIYMDDVLVFGRTQDECTYIYQYIENYLSYNYDLQLNVNKTLSGRFSTEVVDFCGWRFAGGYATITPDKVEGFKTRIATEIKACKRTPLPALIKRVNRKIDGFGNYYKYGNVLSLYEQLDAYVRTTIRDWVTANGGCGTGSFYTNKGLTAMGLHSLTDKYNHAHKGTGTHSAGRIPNDVVACGTKRDSAPMMENIQIQQLACMEKLVKQNAEMLRMQRRQLRMINELLSC